MIGSRTLASTPRRLSFTVFVVGCALSVVACGGSSTVRNTTRSSAVAQAVAYAGCMRSHGVPNFRDPIPGRGLDIPSTINTQSRSYLSAQQTCTKLLPSPSAGHPMPISQQRHLIAAAKCMRAHGVDITDPTFHGPYITLDEPNQTTIDSPAFKTAEPVCHYPLPANPASSTARP